MRYWIHSEPMCQMSGDCTCLLLTKMLNWCLSGQQRGPLAYILKMNLKTKKLKKEPIIDTQNNPGIRVWGHALNLTLTLGERGATPRTGHHPNTEPTYRHLLSHSQLWKTPILLPPKSSNVHSIKICDILWWSTDWTCRCSVVSLLYSRPLCLVCELQRQ